MSAKYKVTIEEIVPREDNHGNVARYDTVELYSQKLEHLNIPKLIILINKDIEVKLNLNEVYE